ncbi:MAG: condensation domain-containing protein, partial [Acidobacteria bacterium]|nr:condensation domain-containing protein [Acidobacteriota bacterium]
WLNLARREAQRAYDLSRGPLLRVILLRLDEEDYIVLFTIHHIIADGWSVQLLVREIDELCRVLCGGLPSVLEELSIQYADFAIWERERLQGEVLESQLAYWKTQLAGAPTRPQLVADKPRPAIQGFHGARQSLQLSMELSEQIKELSRRENTTIFMTMLAALRGLLYRYTGEDDLCIGAPVSGRTQPETEGIIGCFVNTVVMRVNLNSNSSFRELLGRVRELALEAYMRPSLPFEMLVAELQPTRDLGSHPLFQIFFRIDSPLRPINMKWLSLSQLEVKNETAKFDMEWSIAEVPQGFVTTVNYNTELFESATISSMLEHYEMLLSEVTSCPERALLDIKINNAPDWEINYSMDLPAAAQFAFEL